MTPTPARAPRASNTTVLFFESAIETPNTMAGQRAQVGAFNRQVRGSSVGQLWDGTNWCNAFAVHFARAGLRFRVPRGETAPMAMP